MCATQITQKERQRIRELAKLYMEYAHLPVMREREKLWRAHNALAGERPLIVMESGPFIKEMLPPPECESLAAREIESALLRWIVNHELIDDDKAIPPYFSVNWDIQNCEFGLEDVKVARAKTGGLAFQHEHPMPDIKNGLSKLKPSSFSVDRRKTLEAKTLAEDLLGDIIPVAIRNGSLTWSMVPSSKINMLMGMEAMLFAFVENPDEMHALYRFITDDVLAFVRWQEREGLLCPNNGFDYIGGGSYGFSDELPGAGGFVTANDLWGHLNSQETLNISPKMFSEFVYPYYAEIADAFGLIYYGCCEPVHAIWKDCLSQLPNLRKISVSPWCDEEFMGSALAGGGVIYSRKPSPNYIGADRLLDEEAFSRHIAKTLAASKGCRLEFIFRDIYTVFGDKGRAGRAVGIVRRLIDKHWR